ncbi:relaxin-3 receptor 1-like [Trachemys scripta elegans]|uniref:relaxin-3 receptor 1-like n=1 Tax=Trachemys scripta elegans TaxID=31138 RepID=UPI001557AD0C|nr:relaxin-3 receptor 1-like [Trachemys scripta elegans]
MFPARGGAAWLDGGPANASGGRPNTSAWERPSFRTLQEVAVPARAALALRILIAAVYLGVCALGAVGNLLVLLLLRGRPRPRRPRSSLDAFVRNLAATDLQFALTLPFWAADTALDFSWPFGGPLCTLVLSATVLNMYASAFFLTALSVARYRSVASALRRPSGRLRPGSVRCLCALLWAAACLATLPAALFSAVRRVAGEPLCLLHFPEGRDWLALYHLQKILLAFVLPLATLSLCYLLLLHRLGSARPRGSRVTRAVTIAVLAFFLCWLPNQALTLWGVLVKLGALPWDRAYYLVHAYLFPVTVCLAHANSGLNPLLYCLLRPEFRQRLRELCWGRGRMGARARSLGPG